MRRGPIERGLWSISRTWQDPASNEEKLHAVMIIVLDVLGVAKKRLDRESGLFEALADGGRFGRFAGFKFAAGKFPQARQGHALGPLADQEAAIVLDDGDGDGCRRLNDATTGRGYVLN